MVIFITPNEKKTELIEKETILLKSYQVKNFINCETSTLFKTVSCAYLKRTKFSLHFKFYTLTLKLKYTRLYKKL